VPFATSALPPRADVGAQTKPHPSASGRAQTGGVSRSPVGDRCREGRGSATYPRHVDLHRPDSGTENENPARVRRAGSWERLLIQGGNEAASIATQACRVGDR
jgi:hypothetical protein